MDRHTPTRLVANADVLTTLRAMRTEALKAKKDLEVRRLVEVINEGVAEGDYSSELLAIYYWVKQHVRYMRDIDGVEFLKSPRKLLETKSGDCDDIATLLAAMFMAAGNPVAFSIASFDNGRSFSHVFVEAMTPHGPIIFDPVANRVTGEMLQRMSAKKVFPLHAGPGNHDAGVGRAPHVGMSGANIYSVFDYNTLEYTYYEAASSPIPATGSHRPPSVRTKNGTAPESIAARLPAGARKVGDGNEPRGQIATQMRPSALGVPSGLGITLPKSFLYFGMGLATAKVLSAIVKER